jgi:hypothetical protein
VQNVLRMHCTAERPGDGSIVFVVGADAVLSMGLKDQYCTTAVGSIIYAEPEGRLSKPKRDR